MICLFDYAKPDSRLAAYGGVVLQRFEFKFVWEKTIIGILASILIFLQ